jgi:hypothetical protein
VLFVPASRLTSSDRRQLGFNVRGVSMTELRALRRVQTLDAVRRSLAWLGEDVDELDTPVTAFVSPDALPH